MSGVPATQYSISLKVTLANRPGVLGLLTTAIGVSGGNIFAVDGFVAKGPTLERVIVVNCSSESHQKDHTQRLVGPHLPYARRWQG